MRSSARCGRNGRTPQSFYRSDGAGSISCWMMFPAFGVSGKFCRIKRAVILRFRNGPGAKAVDHHRYRIRERQSRKRAGPRSAVRPSRLPPWGSRGQCSGPCSKAGTVDLRRILARERATAVTTHSTVGVNNDLTAREPGVAVRSADDETAGRIDVILGLGIHHVLRDHRGR